MSAAGPSSPHTSMLGARWVARWSALRRPSTAWEVQPQGLFLLWLAYMGLLTFAAVLLWQHGVWAMLLRADPTGLTLCIVVVFVVGSLWVGRRAWCMGQQHAVVQARGPQSKASWQALFQQERAALDLSTARDLLSERCHGPHEMGWWVNGILVKLGLLGKVIGFSILAFDLARLDNFDPSQTAALLQTLTGGLGVALLTTMAGLTANMLLGVQLMRLDRYGDALVMAVLSSEAGTSGGH